MHRSGTGGKQQSHSQSQEREGNRLCKILEVWKQDNKVGGAGRGITAFLPGRDAVPGSNAANDVEEGKIMSVTLTSSKAAEGFRNCWASSSDVLAAAFAMGVAPHSSHRERELGKKKEPICDKVHAAATGDLVL